MLCTAHRASAPPAAMPAAPFSTLDIVPRAPSWIGRYMHRFSRRPAALFSCGRAQCKAGRPLVRAPPPLCPRMIRFMAHEREARRLPGSPPDAARAPANRSQKDAPVMPNVGPLQRSTTQGGKQTCTASSGRYQQSTMYLVIEWGGHMQAAGLAQKGRNNIRVEQLWCCQ